MKAPLPTILFVLELIAGCGSGRPLGPGDGAALPDALAADALVADTLVADALAADALVWDAPAQDDNRCHGGGACSEGERCSTECPGIGTPPFSPLGLYCSCRGGGFDCRFGYEAPLPEAGPPESPACPLEAVSGSPCDQSCLSICQRQLEVSPPSQCFCVDHTWTCS